MANDTSKKKIAWLAILAGLLIMVGLFFFQRNDERLKKAEEAYFAGELAKTLFEREQHFNEALRLYKDLELEYHPKFGNGKLYYNIGNVYFQLGEYPWAILYFSRAQELMPREDTVKKNLAVAEKKLSLPNSAGSTTFSKMFFFHSYFSLPERIQIFFISCLLAFLLTSLYVWKRKKWIKDAIIASLFLTSIMLLSIGYTQYIAQTRAILIKSTDLYRDAGKQYAKIGERPLSAGTQVEVLDVRDHGRWLQVLSPQGDPGYVPQEAIRLI